ncbi:DUF2142 domain-containing protein [Frankia sp. AgB32]|uniref:DUF2142 domain-containing protein n=1 Tax=Frankia sp. AgB32 TaxID=631119 RepID=UPI00200C32BB|nr:DUF2142 domain-containing protein [Frankia sp. AgB32]MCK9898314.1 DUF2142 domain-containing protein [Frankia sp. AgB32]
MTLRGFRGSQRGRVGLVSCGSRLVRILVVAGFTLLLSAWVGSNAPGFGPDEPANFVKEVGAGTGQWTGSPGRLAHPAFGTQPGAAERIDWINRNSRVFELPTGLDPGAAGFPCDLFRNWLSARCLHRPHSHPPATRALTYVGTYEPYVYAIPGTAMARAHSALAALYTGRAVSALLVAGLLAVAVTAAWEDRAGPISQVGVLLAVSPMVLFMGSVLGTNGIEIAGALALYTVALRMGREAAAPRWTWLAAGVIAALLALSRATGPAWVVLAPLLGIAFAQRVPHQPSDERHRLRRRSPRRIRPRMAWLLLPAAGIAATAAWERAVQPHPNTRWEVAVAGLRRLPVDTHAWTRQWVGVFGWASIPMPTYAYRLWWIAVIVLVLVAFAVASWRARLGLAAVLVAGAALAVALDVLVLRQTRFPVYGRYLLPLAVALPLAAGEIVTRRAATLRTATRGVLQITVPLIVAATHLVALWADARRFAVGVGGPVWFLPHAQWAPPGGWLPWLALTVAGTTCLVACAIIGALTAGRTALVHLPAPGPPRRRPVR